MRVALKLANKSPLIINTKKKALATRFVARAFLYINDASSSKRCLSELLSLKVRLE